jgi:hypothetical protein
MSELPVDGYTADRLLSGDVAPEDAPSGLEGVAALIEMVRAEPTRAELVREAETIAAMSAALSSGVPRRSKGSGRSRGSVALKLLAATIALTLVLGTGLALAGTLPASLQEVASGVLAKIGISVPNGNADSNSGGATTEAPPEAALYGLCTAWQSGQGGEKGKKNDATALQRLSTGAGTASVQDFCTDVIADHTTAHANSGKGPGHGASTAEEKSRGHSGGSGKGNKP